MGHKIPILTSPEYGPEEIQAVTQTLKSEKLAQDKFVGYFERELAEYLEVKPEYVIATSSGTAALHIAVELNYTYPCKTRIKVPATTFISTSNVIKYSGHQPIYVDIDPKTWNCKLDSGISVDLYGSPCGPYGNIIDACESLGAQFAGKKCGTIGKINCLSFFENKPITTGGEGGAIIIQNEELALKARRMRTQGKLEEDVYHAYPGFNYRMTEMQAAFGIEQLKKLDERISEKRRIHKTYMDLLEGKAIFQKPLDGASPSWFLNCVMFDCVEKRLKVGNELAKNGIETRMVFEPPNTFDIYEKNKVYPNSDKLYNCGLCLPSGPTLANEQIERICRIILGVL